MSAFSWRLAVLAALVSLPLQAQPQAELPIDAMEAPGTNDASMSTAETPAAIDSAAPVAPGDTVPTVPQAVAAVDSTPAVVLPQAPSLAPAPALPEAAVGRTRQLKSDPLASARYRSPRKAFFYSLMLPGAGQAYTGHWARGAAYLAMDVTLGVGWWYYGIHKSDEKMKQSRDWADAHWRQSKYEKNYKQFYDNSTKDSTATDVISTMNPSRVSYCASLFGTGNVNYDACAEVLPDPSVNLQYNQYYATTIAESELSTDQVSALRAQYPNSLQFYSLIGQENEFIQGWDDATGAPNYDLAKATYYDPLTDGNIDTKAMANPFGTSAAQGVYLSMRQKSNDYAKMKTWFLGGMILNHLISAVDAALLAQSSNRSLYDMESHWWEGVQLWGGMAWNGTPVTQAMAWVNF